MTLNHLVKAVASQLQELWPDRAVNVNRMPDKADGSFYVGIIDADQSSELDRRRRRTVSIEVLYFLKSNDNMLYHDWAEAMFDSFEHLTVKENEDKTRKVRLTNISARADTKEKYYQFLFDVTFTFVLASPPGEVMETLTQKEILIYER